MSCREFFGVFVFFVGVVPVAGTLFGDLRRSLGERMLKVVNQLEHNAVFPLEGGTATVHGVVVF